MKVTLFDIAIAIADKVNEIIDAVMERSEKETIDSLYTELDGLYESREAKLESYVHVIKNAEAAAKACKEQANEFYAKSKALDGLARRLKETLLGDLTQHGEKTANAGLFKITRRKSPASVIVLVPASELPPEFQRVRIEADKTALKKALSENGGINGVTLDENSEHVRLSVR